jgi:hypothetical protein
MIPEIKLARCSEEFSMIGQRTSTPDLKEQESRARRQNIPGIGRSKIGRFATLNFEAYS